MPGLSDPNSLATVKYNIGLGYGDIALVGQSIIRCLEYELGVLRSEFAAELATMRERIETLENERSS